jgi:hypothetical protein
MLKIVVVTDLTKMRGDWVCIAGIDQSGKSIRPILKSRAGGVSRSCLYIGNRLAIQPRAKIGFNFRSVRVEPPHIEDLGFVPSSISYQGVCNDVEWESVLKSNLFHSVQDIYDGLLQSPHWVHPGAKTRSLGTVIGVEIIDITFEERDDKREYRMHFVDSKGHRYSSVIINDLAFQAFAAAEVKRLQSNVSAARLVRNLIKRTDRLYVRLGLARPWLNPNTGRIECWMQVTGIHTFPDYLGGKSFADF